MGNIGSSELLVILVLALLLLGPKRLPEVGASLGRTLRRFRQASSDLRDELDVDRVIARAGTPPPRREVEPPPDARPAPRDAEPAPRDAEPAPPDAEPAPPDAEPASPDARDGS